MIDVHGRAVRRRIADWAEAGLIDAGTAARLVRFEDARGPGGSLGTLTNLGLLALALGVVALVSANWDEIPAWVRLGGHAALNLALGLAAHAGLTRERLGPVRLGFRAREGILLLLSASTLALLAHVGQTFQLQGDALGLLAAWLALVTPFTLAAARSGINRWAWTAGALATAGLALAEHAEWLADRRLLSTALALPIVAAHAAPLAFRTWPGAAGWGHHLRLVALGALAALTSAAQLAWRLEGGEDLALGSWWSEGPAGLRLDVLLGAGVATAGLVAACLAEAGRARPETREGEAFPTFVVASPTWAALPLLIGGAGSPLVEAGALCLYWAAAAGLARAHGRADLYRLAVGLVAARVLLVFLEAFGGLLLTGFGLVAGGVLLLALGYAARRLLARPGREA
jgi:hypothetical protein